MLGYAMIIGLPRSCTQINEKDTDDGRDPTAPGFLPVSYTAVTVRGHTPVNDPEIDGGRAREIPVKANDPKAPVNGNFTAMRCQFEFLLYPKDDPKPQVENHGRAAEY